jgi:nitrile hydratase accessory protein
MDGKSLDREATSAARVAALESLLVDKGVITSETVDTVLAFFERDVGPFNGAKLVAKAWLDPAYKARVLNDLPAAIAELGIPCGGTGAEGEHMKVVENTPEVHNLIVCTLCSCDPWPLLGLPPYWYGRDGAHDGGGTGRACDSRGDDRGRRGRRSAGSLTKADAMLTRFEHFATTSMVGSIDAPPRGNGELLFTHEWESRAFAMAIALSKPGYFEWEDFREQLIATIREWEAGGHPQAEWNYYERWLTALERVLRGTELGPR